MLACVLLFCYQIDIVSEASQPAAVSTPGDSYSLSLDLLEQLKAQLPESLFATVSGAIAGYEKQLDTKSNELQYARLKIQLLEEKLRLQRIAKYGPGSEKLSNLQLEFLEFEPGVSNVEVTAEGERDALLKKATDEAHTERLRLLEEPTRQLGQLGVALAQDGHVR